METVKNILNEVKENTGIRRIHMQNFNLNIGIEYFYKIAQALIHFQGKKFDPSQVESIIKMIIEWTYLLNDKLDYHKGFILKGHTGRGKTFLFKAWIKFLEIDGVRYYHDGHLRTLKPSIVNTRQISSEFQDPEFGGNKVIMKYAKVNCLVLDDIGAEQEVSMSYGNRVNVVEEIISRREEMNMLTFGTTNLNRMEKSKDNPKGYDSRTVSRMYSLFNIMPITHETDYRTI